jgi:TPR repeat protein/transglutaminase-like putative cysteine protease
MRILFLILLAALTAIAPCAYAAPAKSQSSIGKEDPTFSRGTPVPAWAMPLSEPASTERNDPVVIRLSDTHVRVATVPAVVRSRVIQVNERSSLSRIGQFAIDYLPKHQKLYLHKVAILRGTQVLDRTASVNIRLLDREQGLEQGVYGGARSAQLLMEDVRVGDALWVVYTLEGENPVFGQAWSGEFAIDAEEPVELLRLSVTHPKDKPLYWRQLGDFRTEAVEPVIETIGQQERLRFERRGIDAVEAEAAVSPDYFPYRLIQFSEYADWHRVATWATSLFPPVTRSPELEKLVATFRKESSQEAQASAALRWVQDEIRYFSVSIGENSHRPQAPDVVIKHRYGDCKDKSYLLTSILNRLGLQARTVLVNAQSRQLPGKVLPAPTWFDHAIVRVELDGKTYFVDPTRSSERGLISLRPAVLPGGLGLVVDAGSTVLDPIGAESMDLPSLDIAEKISVPSMDGAGELESRHTYRSLFANWAREHYAGLSEREMRNELLASLEKQYPGATLTGKPKMVDNESENSFQVIAHYQLPNLINKKEDVYSIDYDSKIMAGTLQVPGKATRNFPLALTPSHHRYHLQIDWPNTVRIVGLPAAQDISNPYFSMHEEYLVLGNRTELLLDYVVKTSEVAAKEVPAMLLAAKKLNASMEASFRVSAGNVVKAEARSLPLRHLAALRNSIQDAERIRFSAAMQGGDDEKIKQLCAATADAIDMRPISPLFERLMKDMVASMESYTKDPGVRRCLAQLDFGWGDFERALTYYEAENPLKDDDVLLDELAWARLLAADADGAIHASKRYVDARIQAGVLNAYDMASALALYARAHKELPGELRAQASRFADGPWPRPVLAYQLGVLKEADLLALAGKEDADRRDRMLSDAWFYVAQQRYAQGDIAGGRIALKWVKMHGIFGTPQLHQALGELWHADYGDADFRNGQIAVEAGDKKKAVELLQRAGKRGHGAALSALAFMYRTGDGVSQDTARAVELFRSAAANGNTNAMNTLGSMYASGEGLAQSEATAVEWWLKAAAEGDYYASRNIGWRYRRGKGVAKDDVLARQFLTDSAELGYADAQGELADLYLNGESVAVDYALASYWASRAIDGGNVHGKSILGYLYAYGRGVKQDLPQAIALWKAAVVSDEMAQFQLGLAYSTGRGVAKDTVRARILLAVAAASGNLYAKLYYCDLMVRDKPSAKEAESVITSLTALAKGGVTEAAEFLGQYYTNGIGVPKDVAAGAYWSKLAAGKGNRPVKEGPTMVGSEG